MIRFGICMATYFRQNGLSYFFLKKSLDSILKQTYPHWKLFLIGDCYEPREEFEKIVKSFPQERIYSYNLSVSIERRKYKDAKSMWKVGGTTPNNVGIRKIKQEGFDVIARLDDDDWWLPDHLELIAETYEKYPLAGMVYTQSTFKNGTIPSRIKKISYNNLPPKESGLAHSSATWKPDLIPLEYRDLIEHKVRLPSFDADMWERIRNYCNEKDIKTVFVPKLTVRHDYEGTDVIPFVPFS